MILPFRKKEMSKSTPALNLILSRDHGDPSAAPTTQLLCPVPRRARAINRHHPPSRPLSYVDTFYGSDGEPKFGDRPASVVEVFKKDPLTAHLSQSERNLVRLGTEEGRRPEPSALNLNWESKLASTSRKLKAGRSNSTEIQRIRYPAHRLIKERKDSLPILPSQNDAKVFRSELQFPLLVSSTAYQFPVHKVVHTTPPPSSPEDEIVKTGQSPSLNELKFSSSKLGVHLGGGEVKQDDENEEIDLELEALREESSRSTASTAEVETLLAESPADAEVSVQSEFEMSTTCSSSAASSPQFFFKDTRQQRNPANQNPKQVIGSNKVNGKPNLHNFQKYINCQIGDAFFEDVSPVFTFEKWAEGVIG